MPYTYTNTMHIHIHKYSHEQNNHKHINKRKQNVFTACNKRFSPGCNRLIKSSINRHF